MRWSFAVSAALVVALAHGQGYSRRYDPNGLGRAQTAWGIEQNGSAGHFVFTASSEIDTLSPDSVVYYAAIYFSRIDLNGDTVFNRKHYLPGYGIYPGWANCCDSTQNGLIVGGGRQSFAGVDEVYLISLNGQGDTLWTRVFGGTNQYWIGRQVKCTPDGGFLIVGDTDASGYVDGFALKTDSLGNEQWRRTYGGGLIDGLVSVDRAEAGYLIGGVKFLGMDDSQFWVQRIDTLGNLLWEVDWGGPFEESNAQLVTLGDGHALVAGSIGYAIDFGDSQPYLAKLDSADGSIIWEREYGPSAYSTTFFAAKERPNGDLIACGVSYASGDQQGLLLRTTSQGDSIWMRSYYYQDTLLTTGQGRFYDVLPTEDGGFIAAGSAYNPAGGPYPPGYSQDTWVVKVDSMGCIVPGCGGVGVQEVVTNLSGALKLYPNPAAVNGRVTVELTLPTSVQINTPLRLVLTSIQGQLVKELELPTQHDQRVVLDLGGLAAGLYSVHIADGGRWLTGARLVVTDP